MSLVIVLTGPDTKGLSNTKKYRDIYHDYVKNANNSGTEKSHIVFLDQDSYLDKIDQELKGNELAVSDKAFILYCGHGVRDLKETRHELVVGNQTLQSIDSTPTIEVLKGIQEKFSNAKNFALVKCPDGQFTDDLLNDKSISNQLSDGTSVSTYIDRNNPLLAHDMINWLKTGFENTKDKIPDNTLERFFIKKGMIIDDNDFNKNLNFVYKKSDGELCSLKGRFMNEDFKFHPDLKTEFLEPKDKESVNSMTVQRNNDKWGEYLVSYFGDNKDGMVDDATKYFDQYSKESKLKTLRAIMNSYTQKENNVALQKK